MQGAKNSLYTNQSSNSRAKNPLCTNHRTFHKTFIRRVGRLSVFRIAARRLSVEWAFDLVFRIAARRLSVEWAFDLFGLSQRRYLSDSLNMRRMK